VELHERLLRIGEPAGPEQRPHQVGLAGAGRALQDDLPSLVQRCQQLAQPGRVRVVQLRAEGLDVASELGDWGRLGGGRLVRRLLFEQLQIVGRRREVVGGLGQGVELLGDLGDVDDVGPLEAQPGTDRPGQRLHVDRGLREPGDLPDQDRRAADRVEAGRGLLHPADAQPVAVDGRDEVVGAHAKHEVEHIALLRIALDDLEVAVAVLDESAERALAQLGRELGEPPNRDRDLPLPQPGRDPVLLVDLAAHQPGPVRPRILVPLLQQRSGVEADGAVLLALQLDRRGAQVSFDVTGRLGDPGCEGLDDRGAVLGPQHGRERGGVREHAQQRGDPVVDMGRVGDQVAERPRVVPGVPPRFRARQPPRFQYADEGTEHRDRVGLQRLAALDEAVLQMARQLRRDRRRERTVHQRQPDPIPLGAPDHVAQRTDQ